MEQNHFSSKLEYVVSEKMILHYNYCCAIVMRQSLFVVVVCSGLTSLSTLFVISRRCLVETGSSMLTFIVLPHYRIRSQTLLPDTTSSHIILTPERPVLALPSALPQKSECQAGSNLSTIVNDFGMSRPGIEPGTSRCRSGQISL